MCHSRILSPSKPSGLPTLFPLHLPRAEMFALRRSDENEPVRKILPARSASRVQHRLGAAKKVLFSSRDNCNCLILKQFERTSYFLGIQAWVLRQNWKQKKYAQKSGHRSTFSFLISLFFIISQNACSLPVKPGFVALWRTTYWKRGCRTILLPIVAKFGKWDDIIISQLQAIFQPFSSYPPLGRLLSS